MPTMEAHEQQRWLDVEGAGSDFVLALNQLVQAHLANLGATATPRKADLINLASLSPPSCPSYPNKVVAQQIGTPLNCLPRPAPLSMLFELEHAQDLPIVAMNPPTNVKAAGKGDVTPPMVELEDLDQPERYYSTVDSDRTPPAPEGGARVSECVASMSLATLGSKFAANDGFAPQASQESRESLKTTTGPAGSVALPKRGGANRMRLRDQIRSSTKDLSIQGGRLTVAPCRSPSEALLGADVDPAMGPTMRGSFLTGYEDIMRGASTSRKTRVYSGDKFSRWVRSAWFECIFTVLIILNTVVVVFEVQYHSIDIGFDLGYPGSLAGAHDTWPGAIKILTLSEQVFGLVFAVEVVAKLVVWRSEFFRSPWNLLDAGVVLCWLISVVLPIGVNPTVLRFFRLARVLRLIRLIKWIEMLDALHILINSIQASLSVTVWAFLLIGVMVTLSALSVSYITSVYLMDETESLAQRREVYQYFGSFTRSAISMFEVTLGNFGPIMRVMTENIGEGWGIFFVLYKCVGGFSVVSVITGVFLHETFGVANSDPDLMVITARRKKQAHLLKMNRLFVAADRTGEGALSFLDFSKLMSDSFIQSWLAAYELDVFDVQLLFDLVDDGDGRLTAEELVTGIARLKGTARSMDLHELMQDIDDLIQAVDALKTFLVLPRDSSPCQAVSENKWHV